MDLYGKLNNEIVKKEYAGSTTDTAKTIVDNTSNVIKTEVKRVPGKLTIDIEDTDIDYIYDGSEDVPVKIPTVGTVSRLEQRVNELDAEINGKISNLSGIVSDQGQTINNLSNQVTQLNSIVAENTQDITALKTSVSSLEENVSEIDSKIVVASKQQMGMVYAWVDQNGKAYISLTDPEKVIVNIETLPDGSEAYDIETYNYSVQLLPNGSLEYNIGE